MISYIIFDNDFSSSSYIIIDNNIKIVVSSERNRSGVGNGERTKAGLERVRSRGKKLGRPQTADVTAIRELRQQGSSLAQIALRCNISRARVHQIVSA